MRLILIALMLTGCTAMNVKTTALAWKSPQGLLIKYRWSAPPELEKGETYPLVVFLHGSGERGDDNSAQLNNGVSGILEGAEKLHQPCFLIAPQCPARRMWAPIGPQSKRLTAADRPNDLMDSLVSLIDHITKTYPVDPKRIYVTGLSMGGFGTWDLLGRMPKRIAAAVPVCGGGDPALAPRFKDVAIHAFHGENDTEVPVAATEEMIVALRKAGGKPRVTYYPGVGHDSWSRTYDNLDVIRWMFEQRRK